mmetsp:Transcript_91782/g.148182  ORF Transcript_91782/g.148182 Transcript_91782/m.148182 type:complete len:315 (+) Transcript_91782:81-1025(+)
MPWTLAHSAAGDNDINELGRILAAHTDLNVSDNAGLVPLHVAAGEGAAQAVKFLCENGADVNSKTSFEHLTALHRAVEEGHNECLEVLVAAGADLNARSKDGYTPLHEASRSGFVFTAQLLVESNAEINAVCNKHTTPLHMALQFGHPEVVSALVEAGAEIHVQDDYGISPCDIAETEEMMRAVGMFKSVVMLENTALFVLKVVERIEKESGIRLRDGLKTVENARFRTLFNNKEFLVFIDRRKFADKRLAEIRKGELESQEWKAKYLGAYYNTNSIVTADVRHDSSAIKFIHSAIIGKYPPTEDPPLEAPAAK